MFNYGYTDAKSSLDLVVGWLKCLESLIFKENHSSNRLRTPKILVNAYEYLATIYLKYSWNYKYHKHKLCSKFI